MTKHALRTIVGLFFAFGIVAFCFVLVQSWKPTSRSKRIAIVLEVPKPPPGTYVAHDFERARALIVAQPSGQIRVFAVPLRDSRVVLPDIHWWRLGALCSDFRTESRDGTLTASSTFECRDADFQPWGGITWRWTIDGKNLYKAGDIQVDDLLQVDFEESASTIRIYNKNFFAGDV